MKIYISSFGYNQPSCQYLSS